MAIHTHTQTHLLTTALLPPRNVTLLCETMKYTLKQIFIHRNL